MSAKPARISAEMLAQLRHRLETLPPKAKTDYTRQETVQELETLIRHAVSTLGYSIPDIAALYMELGTEISGSTISSILRDLAPKTAAKKAAPTRKVTRATTPSPAMAPVDASPPVATPEELDPELLADLASLEAEEDEQLITTYCPPELR